MVVLTDASAWPIIKHPQLAQLKPVFDSLNKERLVNYIYKGFQVCEKVPSSEKAKPITTWRNDFENFPTSSYSLADKNKSSSQ